MDLGISQLNLFPNQSLAPGGTAVSPECECNRECCTLGAGLFPSLLAGAVLLDLEQTTLPGIAHLMVETMIISDQIRAEDRANVLRALLLKHRWVDMDVGSQGSGVICEPQVAREAGPLMATTLPLSHPNDEKEGFFPRNHSSSSVNSIVGNHHHNHTTDTCVPLMGEERIEMADPKANETECKEVRVTWGCCCVFSYILGTAVG